MNSHSLQNLGILLLFILCCSVAQAAFSQAGTQKISQSSSLANTVACTLSACNREDYFSHLDLSLINFGNNFIVHSNTSTLKFVARQTQYDLKTFIFYSADTSSPDYTFQLTNWYGVDTMDLYNTTIYGFTYSVTDDFIDTVVFDQITNEIRIQQHSYAGTAGSFTIEAYRVVQKDNDLIEDLENGVGLHVASFERSPDTGYFIMFLAGTVKNPYQSNDTDYYIAYFDTKYNNTMWYRQSDLSGLNETVRGIHYNPNISVCFMAVEVMTNSYMNATLQNLVADINVVNKSSIAIVAYDLNCKIRGVNGIVGNRKWIQLLGDPTLNASFKNMDSYGMNLYVFIQVDDQPASINTRTFNLVLYVIRMDTGYIHQTEYFGGVGLASSALDVQVNYKGVWLMALIGNNFCQESNCYYATSVWKTGNSAIQTWAMILLDHGLSSIIDIEGWTTLNVLTEVSLVPTRFFMSNQNNISLGNEFQFIFVAQRDDYSGLYYAVYSTNLHVFSEGSGCKTGCMKCDTVNTDYCIQCKTNYQYQEGSCVLNTTTPSSPLAYYLNTDYVSGVKYYAPCHYSCSDSCTSLISTCKCVSTSVTAVGTKCTCTPGSLVNDDGTCASKCSSSQYGLVNNICVSSCPYNSLAYLDFTQSTAALNTSPRSSTTYSNGLVLMTKSTGIQLNLASQITQLPSSFTFSFWVVKINDGTTSMGYNFDLINAFGRLYFYANYTTSSTHSIFWTLIGSSSKDTLPASNTMNADLPIGSWIKVSVSVKTISGNLYDMYYQSQSSSGTTYASSLTNKVNLGSTLYNNYIYVGVVTLPSTNHVFPGSFKDIAFFSGYHSPAQMTADQFRSFRGYGMDQYSLLTYYPLVADNSNSVIAFQLNDYSPYEAAATVFLTNQSNAISPSFKSVPTLTLSIFDSVAICNMVYTDTTELDQMTMRGDFLLTNLEKLTTTSLYGSTYSMSSTDRILICNDNCSCPGGEQGMFQVIAVSFGGLTIESNTEYPPIETATGEYYEICYSITTSTQKVSLPLGQIYICKSLSLLIALENPPQYIYPFNRGVYIDSLMTFTGSGGDIAYNDQLYFCQGSSCMSTCTASVTFARQSDWTFNTQAFKTQGTYLMCYQSSYNYDQGLSQYIQVNDFNYWIVTAGTNEFSSYMTQNSFSIDTTYLYMDVSAIPALPGDEFRFFCCYSTYGSCSSNSQMGQGVQSFNIYANGYPIVTPVWLGYRTGINGFTSTKSQLHVCFSSGSLSSPGTFSSVSNFNYDYYFIQATDYTTNSLNTRNPEINSWFIEYGGTITYNATVFFTFFPYPSALYVKYFQNIYQQVYPCGHPTNGQQGQISITRMAVDANNNILETNEIVWQLTNLTDVYLQTTQGELDCQYGGYCSLNFSSYPLVEGEIYRLNMYSYSFMILDQYVSSEKYYLYGSGTNDVVEVYSHLFFVRNWEIYQQEPQSIISYSQTYIELNGRGLLYANNTRAQLYDTKTSTVNDFKTYGINITFNVKNSPTCLLLQYPLATILSQDISDDKIIIRDMDFSSCKTGALYANVSLFRGIQNPQTLNFSNVYVTNQMSIFVGTIGCDPACLYCNGSTPNSCTLCTDYSNQYLNNGSCLYQCPPDAPYYISYSSTYNYNSVTAYMCQQWCPETTYPEIGTMQNDGAIFCQSCFPDCQYCNNTQSPQQCLMCNPIKYLFDGACLSACPDNDMDLAGVTNAQALYQMNYTDFTCYVDSFLNSVNPMSNIYVQLAPLGYRIQIPKDEVTYLKAVIILYHGSNISIQWKQLDPSVDYQAITNVSTPGVAEDFILEGITALNNKTGYITGTSSYNQIQRSTFNSYSSSIAYRVILKIQNEYFDTNYDIIEFVGNAYPKIGSIFLNSSQPYLNATMSAFIIADTVNQSSTSVQPGWYDSYSDTVSELYFMYYINGPDAKYMLKPYTFQKTYLQFMIPFIGDYSGLQSVSIYIYARDMYSACKSSYAYFNISSTYLPSMRYYPWLSSIFPALIQNGSLAGDTYYQLLVSNFFESAFSSPLLPLYSGALCISDYHCFSNGICSYDDQGKTYCDCNVGYGGGLCQLQIDEVAYAQLITNATISLLDQYFAYHTYSDLFINGDLEFVVMILRGFLNSYDSISIPNIYKGLYWMQRCMQAHIEVIYTYDSDFYDDFFTVMDRALGKFHYDLRVLEANQTKKQADLDAYRLSLNETMVLYDFCLNEFMRVLLLKMNVQTFYSYSYTGTNIQVVLNRSLSADILNTTSMYGAAFWTFGDGDITIRATSNFLNGIPEVNAVSDLRIKQVKYLASPYLHIPSIDNYLESPVVTLEIMDVLTNLISVNITDYLSMNGSGLFEIAFPYTPFRGYDPQFLTCQSYNDDLGMFVKDGCGIQIFDEFTDDDNSCLNCSYVPSQLAVCFCSHLSTFALIYEPTAQNLLQDPNLGIYTDYYGMDYWSASFGFYAVIGAGGAYFFGIFFAIIFDIRPQKRLKHKLFRDFRNITRYGLDHDAEAKAEEEEIVKAKTKGTKHQKGGKAKMGPLGENEELKDEDFMGEGKKPFEKSKGNKKKKGDEDDVAVFEVNFKKPNKKVNQDADIVEQLDDPNESQLKDTSMIGLKKSDTPLGIVYDEMEVDKNPEDKEQLEGGSSEDEEAKEDNKAQSFRSPSKSNSKIQSFTGMVMMKSGRQQATDLEGDSQLFKRADPKQQQPKRGGTSSGFHKNNQESSPFDTLEQYRGGFGTGKAGPKMFKGTVAAPKTQGLSSNQTKEEMQQDPQYVPRMKKKEPLVVQDEADLKSDVGSLVSGFSTVSRKKKERKGKKEPVVIEAEEDFAEIQIQRSATIENQSPPVTQMDAESPSKLVRQQTPIDVSPEDDGIVGSTPIYDQTEQQPTQMSEPHTNPKKGKKPNKTMDGGTSSATDFGESTDGKLASRPVSRQGKGRGQVKSSGMSRISELTHADDNEKRYLRRTDYDNLEEEIKDLGLTKEEEQYQLCNMIKYGNPILSFFCVDSLLFPRHARWTLLFMNIILIWFFCAVIYSNTYSPLTVPEPNKDASSLAYGDLWIAAYAPGATIILMYLFASLFKITDARIKYSADYNTMKEMLLELKKEMYLRYIMAYFITIAVFAAASWYIVTFTADFGWKISWAWFYNGVVGFILNFIVYDLLITFTHFLLYKSCRKVGLCIGFIRNIKQAREEA